MLCKNLDLICFFPLHHPQTPPLISQSALCTSSDTPTGHRVYFANQVFIVIIYSFRNIRWPILLKRSNAELTTPTVCRCFAMFFQELMRLEYKSMKLWVYRKSWDELQSEAYCLAFDVHLCS